MRLSKNIKIFLNFFLGPLIFIWLSYSLYRQIMVQPDLQGAWHSIKENFTSYKVLYMLMVPLLMILNWSIEAYKWKLCVQSIQRVSFFTSFRAVLSGLSFSVIMPNRVGEYLGRALYMKEGNRLRAIPLTIMASCSQVIITFIFGIAGLYLLQHQILSNNIITWKPWIDIILYSAICVLVILLVVYFKLKAIGTWIGSLRIFHKYRYIIDDLSKADATLLAKLLSLSLLRYMVFVMQYYLLYRFFGVNVGWGVAFCTTAVMFLLLALVPTIALVELGLRGEISLKLMGMFSLNFLGIGFTTISIWFINLFLPAAIGSLLILGVKIFRSRNESG